MKSNKNNGLVAFCYQASNLLEKFSLGLAGLIFMVTVSNVIFAVFTRYLLETSYIWTDELARYTLIYFVMIASNAALKNGDHMTINIAHKYFPDLLNTIFKWLRRVICITVYFFLTIKGFEIAWNAWNTTTLGLNIPRAIPLLSIPIGMLLMLIQYLLMQILAETTDEPINKEITSVSKSK
ncbi:MAG: TRAP transporter small permease [Halarsenatibacteraceae bacterium]